MDDRSTNIFGSCCLLPEGFLAADVSEQELHLLKYLKRYFSGEPLEDIDGRSMAAAFRRFDFVELVLNI